ncbi:hypothetical protein HKX48_005621 [Thoreauomyces humboldtii]|nr:hypothetical protein HKX48_005621 [Thoreauomyces humboldtii]
MSSFDNIFSANSRDFDMSSSEQQNAFGSSNHMDCSSNPYHQFAQTHHEQQSQQHFFPSSNENLSSWLYAPEAVNSSQTNGGYTPLSPPSSETMERSDPSPPPASTFLMEHLDAATAQMTMGSPMFTPRSPTRNRSLSEGSQRVLPSDVAMAYYSNPFDTGNMFTTAPMQSSAQFLSSTAASMPPGSLEAFPSFSLQQQHQPVQFAQPMMFQSNYEQQPSLYQQPLPTTRDDLATLAAPVTTGRRPRSNTIPGSSALQLLNSDPGTYNSSVGSPKPSHSPSLGAHKQSAKRHDPYTKLTRQSNRELSTYRPAAPVALAPLTTGGLSVPRLSGITTLNPSPPYPSSPLSVNSANSIAAAGPRPGAIPLLPLPSFSRREQPIAPCLTQSELYAKLDKELVATDFSDITVASLKDLLRARSLPSSGKKAVLTQRLQDELNLIARRASGTLKSEEDPRHPLYHQLKQLNQLRQLQAFHQSMQGFDAMQQSQQQQQQQLVNQPPMSAPACSFGIVTTAPIAQPVQGRARALSDPRFSRPSKSVDLGSPLRNQHVAQQMNLQNFSFKPTVVVAPAAGPVKFEESDVAF